MSRFSIHDWITKAKKAARGEAPSPASGPAPESIEAERDAEILAEWKRHPGLGPSQVRNQLRRKGVKVSTRTVRRVMEDAGYRPPRVKRKKHDERFEAVRPNHMWHLDYVHRFINRANAHTLILLDDCSRFVTGHGVSDAERANFVIETFEEAIERHGKPEMVLHDKGAAFWSWRGVSRVTAYLTELGIDQVVAEHKEWNGKLESFNGNLHTELFDVHRFYDLAEMRRRLASHLHWYNHARTHHALGGLLVPADRFYGRVDEVLARIEAGGGRELELDLRDRRLELFKVVTKDGVPEVWLIGHRLFELRDLREQESGGSSPTAAPRKLQDSLRAQRKENRRWPLYPIPPHLSRLLRSPRRWSRLCCWSPGASSSSAAAILEATQTSRSRAYELSGALTALLPSLVQPVGRPKRPAPAPTSDRAEAVELTRRVLQYLLSHPGATTNTGGRRFYSEGFRRFILDLRAGAADLDLETFAHAVELPLGTLDGWLRTDAPPPPDDTPPGDTSPLDETSLHIQTVIAAWRTWCGSFTAFVTHLKDNLRIPYGQSFVARVLFTYNERNPRRRAGRSVDEAAIRGAFEVFFPNAQWVGDGMQVPVVINGDCFTFNLELDVDAYSGAFVGASIRDEEDSPAVIEAFEDALETVGAAPLALLLDNRSSNHTDDVDKILGDTIRMRSTLGRPQNKAHVEGAFGLFAQQAPPIDVNATSLRDLAKELLRLRVQTFFRSFNHRPRRDRGWKSRVGIHGSETPTEEKVAAARAALEEQRKKREVAAANDLHRTDPVVRRFLDEAFERIGIIDPEQHARAAIARYGRDIAVEALAIFEGKANAG